MLAESGQERELAEQVPHKAAVLRLEQDLQAPEPAEWAVYPASEHLHWAEPATEPHNPAT